MLRRSAMSGGGRNAGAGSCHEGFCFHEDGVYSVLALMSSFGRNGRSDMSTPELTGEGAALYTAGGSGCSGVLPTGPLCENRYGSGGTRISGGGGSVRISRLKIGNTSNFSIPQAHFRDARIRRPWVMERNAETQVRTVVSSQGSSGGGTMTASDSTVSNISDHILRYR